MITTLTFSVTILGIPANAVSLFKALVVIVVCLLQSPGGPAQAAGPTTDGRAPAPVEVPA